ncbi:hypothetical protein CEXT_587091 [Caerostris extrusa]|uniref:Uncharacterized protein n=1 Tax=Caerostris extrusa TaxID=172846 RepID=A0AAV4RTD7_CAEEX|nr:hypothetical protein CEXT_587091 [Caerostris extrusa]
MTQNRQSKATLTRQCRQTRLIPRGWKSSCHSYRRFSKGGGGRERWVNQKIGGGKSHVTSYQGHLTSRGGVREGKEGGGGQEEKQRS